MIDMLLIASTRWDLGGAAFPIAVIAFSIALRNQFRVEKMQKALTELERVVKGHD